MAGRRRARVRDEATWAAVRRAWEGGETAASCAWRFDVGLANLWRRRAAEAWTRDRPEDPRPEPVEGWDAWARRRAERFAADLEAQRELALALLAVLNGGRPDDLSAWHLGFYYHWRARQLGPEAAALDQERMCDQPWAGAVWWPDGGLRPLDATDRALMRMFREDWRREVGLPEGAAPDLP